MTKRGKRATCHPERRLYARGLCSACYHATYESVLDRFWAGMGRPSPEIARPAGIDIFKWDQSLHESGHVLMTLPRTFGPLRDDGRDRRD